MSKMFYEENNNIRRNMRSGRRSSSKMSSWLIKKGIAKTESAASLVLISVALVAILLTVLIIKGDDIKRSINGSPILTEQQKEFQERRDERLNR